MSSAAAPANTASEAKVTWFGVTRVGLSSHTRTAASGREHHSVHRVSGGNGEANGEANGDTATATVTVTATATVTEARIGEDVIEPLAERLKAGRLVLCAGNGFESAAAGMATYRALITQMLDAIGES